MTARATVSAVAEGDGAAGTGEGGAGDGAAEGAAPPRRVAARARAVAAIERAIGPDNGAGQLGMTGTQLTVSFATGSDHATN